MGFRFKKQLIATILTGWVLSVASVKADTTYNYIGSPFNSIQNPAFGSSLNFSVTFDNTVTSNFTGYASLDHDATAFTFYGVGSSGAEVSFAATTPPDTFVIDPIRANLDYFEFVNGQIVSWQISILSPVFGGLAFTSIYNGVGVSGGGDSINTYDNSYNAQNYNFAPTGNIAAVPLPAAVWLFGSALAALIGFNRRKYMQPV